MTHVRISYRASATQTEWRARTCRHCATEFAFSVTHTDGFSMASSPAVASREAQKAVETAIAKDVAPTSCPACGGLQLDMLPEARRRALGSYFAAVVWVAILAIVVAALFGSPGARNEIRWSLLGIITGLATNVWHALASHGWLLMVLAGVVVAWFGVDLASRYVAEKTAAKGLPVGLTRDAFDAQRARDPSMPVWGQVVRRPEARVHSSMRSSP